MIVEIELIAMMNMGFGESCKKIVGGRDGVKVAGEVEIEIRGRVRLREPAARAAALHAKRRS